MEKKYYAITTKVTYEKTVLVPVDNVKDIDDAIDLVDSAIDDYTIDLLEGESEYETKQSPYADENGICEVSDYERYLYNILEED